MAEREEYIQIANEFTNIHIRKVITKNGEKLEIMSNKNDGKILLDAMELESLTLLEPAHFSEFFKLHFGVDTNILGKE